MEEKPQKNDRVDSAELHIGPEYAVAERDVTELLTGEVASGSSLWRDDWRRLLKNKLAVFGMIVVILLALSSLLGPTILQHTTGYTYESIPNDGSLLKSFPPF